MKKFYYKEWKVAEAEGNLEYAAECKEEYRRLVIKSLERPYLQFLEELKAFPPIYLN